MAGHYQLDPNDLQQLRTLEKISNVWSKPPPDGHLHVYVTVPGEGSPRALQLGGCFTRLIALDQDLTNPRPIMHFCFRSRFIPIAAWTYGNT